MSERFLEVTENTPQPLHHHTTITSSYTLHSQEQHPPLTIHGSPSALDCPPRCPLSGPPPRKGPPTRLSSGTLKTKKGMECMLCLRMVSP
eukprot:3318530-Rhodomonas_salina.1